MAKIDTHFSPVTNGYQFANYFKVDFPVKFSLPFAGKLDLKDVVFGLCGGMCAAALDQFYAGVPVPGTDRPDAVDPKLFTYLCERQLQSLSIPVLLKIIEWMMIEDTDLITRMTRVEIPKLRRSLNAAEPVILCLIRAKGMNNPTNNHQVVASAYDITPDEKTITLTLYEPNHPCKEPTITVSLSKNDFQISQSTGEPLRGFFIIPYSRQTTFPRLQAPEVVSFALPDGIMLQWPVDSRVCTQRFNENPEWYSGFGLPGHEGLDLFALNGASVRACADGEVFEAGPRDGHPYGVQVRIRHKWNNEEYHTIYAHLSQTMVRAGQQVKAGQEIGKADSTGNSTGAHLHLTLKKIGAKTGAYPADIIDPWPYLQSGIQPFSEPPVSPSGVTVTTICQLNLRANPDTDAAILTTLPAAEEMAMLGAADVEQPKIGQQGLWLRVRTASSQEGYVAAWLVRETGQQAFPPSGLIVYPFVNANLRSGPGTAFDLLGSYSYQDPLSILGDADMARVKIGKHDQWLQVQAQNGQRGFIAAWLVHSTGEAPPSTGLKVYPTSTVNIRVRPTTDSNVLCLAPAGEELLVLGDLAAVRSIPGQPDQWLNVRTSSRLTGYVAAWLVKTIKQPRDLSSAGLQVVTTDFLNIRAQAATHSPVIDIAESGETLTVITDDLPSAMNKIGQQDHWLYVQRKNGSRGWAAAWFIRPG